MGGALPSLELLSCTNILSSIYTSCLDSGDGFGGRTVKVYLYLFLFPMVLLSTSSFFALHYLTCLTGLMRMGGKACLLELPEIRLTTPAHHLPSSMHWQDNSKAGGEHCLYYSKLSGDTACVLRGNLPSLSPTCLSTKLLRGRIKHNKVLCKDKNMSIHIGRARLTLFL